MVGLRFGCVAAMFVTLVGASSAQGELAITEVVDGTILNGQPSWVQLTNVGTFGLPDLSVYSIGVYADGSSSLSGGASVPLTAVSLAPGASYVVSYEPSGNEDCAVGQTCFEVAYFALPDLFSGQLMDGNDTIALFQGIATGDGSDAVLLDIYGRLGVDGAGTSCEFTDSYAYRCGDSSSSVWLDCDWTVEPVGSLEQGNPAINLVFMRNLTTPFAHVGCVQGACQATPYCQASTSSSGCTAALSGSAAGMPTGLAGDYSVVATGVEESVNGLFFVSLTGASNTPFFPGATLCIRPPAGRTSIQSSGGVGACSGQLSVVVNDPATPWGQLTSPGTPMWVQCFYRDPSALSGLAVSDGFYMIFE